MRATSTSRGKATRAGILETAATLFADKGFDGTALQDIADALGLTRPAVYHYFSSKEDVLASLVSQTSEVPAETMRGIRERTDLDATRKLEEITTLLLSERFAAPERFRLLDRGEGALPADIADKHRAARRRTLADVAAVIGQGIDEGRFRQMDERTTALALLGMCNWVAWWYRPGIDSPEEIRGSFVALAVAMVGRPLDRVPGVAGEAGAIELLRRDVAHLLADIDYLERAGRSDG